MNAITSYVYDTGVLIGAERADVRVRRTHRRILALTKQRPVIPAPVLAQAWRSPRTQARLHWLLSGSREVPFTPTRARRAGELLAASASSDIVDACVVVEAVARRATIVTSDPDDMWALIPPGSDVRVLMV